MSIETGTATVVEAPPQRTGIAVRAIKLKDRRFTNFQSEVEGRWDYQDFVGGKHPDWKHDWISFDCVLADQHRDIIWCGLTSFANDIFFAYDRATGTFRDMNYRAIADRFDAKFHRSLAHDGQGNIWAATALLHDVDQFWNAPGGALVRFEPRNEKLEIVARPMAHLYIQAIAIDQQRGMIYGQCFTPERMFRFDIATGKVTDLGPIGSGLSMGQCEGIAVDRTGACWGTWGVTRAWLDKPGPDEYRLWRYHPDIGQIEFSRAGLPHVSSVEGTCHADGIHTGPDGAVYVGTKESLLCRIDPDSRDVEVLGQASDAGRLAGMVNGPDGNLYGAAGQKGRCSLFRYDLKRRKITDLGALSDGESGEKVWHIHGLTITADGTIYGGENDVPYRSGYLWEIKGAIEA